ncbi:hypothetical protein KQX54_009407 [Cotesia glomerata]|uniref:Uncharacterized protein n=1 Tax=Cotesia glomerata TaxID=32391 RepID=A0AAV7IDW6_COTGL|nr:hypothetical protein KQX54_009407 [Cotesia glomerata]
MISRTFQKTQNQIIFREPQFLELQLSPVAGRLESEITQNNNNTTQTVESNEPEFPKLRLSPVADRSRWKSNELESSSDSETSQRVVTLDTEDDELHPMLSQIE